MQTGKCPHCGESDYIVMYSTSTAVYYPTHIVNGIVVETGQNKITYECRCMRCGKMFSFIPDWEDMNGYEN